MSKVKMTCTRWGRGQLFCASACDTETRLATDLVMRSTEDGLELLRPDTGVIEFGASSRNTRFGCDWLEAAVERGEIRLAFVTGSSLLVEGPVRIEVGDAVRVEKLGERRWAVTSGEPLSEAPPVDEVITQRQSWAEEAGRNLPQYLHDEPLLPKLVQVMKSQVCSPEGQLRTRWTTPDRWPHVYCWLWDTAFHAVGWRHLDTTVAKEQLTAVFGCQNDDGMISHSMRPDSSSDITQPPILAWAVERVLERDDDRNWLIDCYPALSAFMQWLLENRRHDPAGLLQWRTNPRNPLNPCDECGWDNSARFDGAPLLDAVDLNACFSRDCDVLSRLAQRLGRTEDATRWRTLHRQWNDMLNSRCWNSELGLYCDTETETGVPRRLRSPAGLLPLICGAPEGAQVNSLVRTLQDRDVFASPAMIPTVAVADQRGLARVGDMWRGPVWINLNHQIIEGLRQYGQDEMTATLTEATLTLVRKWYGRLGSVFEFYDCMDTTPPPELPRKGSNDPAQSLHQVIHDYGWTATSALDLLCNRQELVS